MSYILMTHQYCVIKMPSVIVVYLYSTLAQLMLFKMCYINKITLTL